MAQHGDGGAPAAAQVHVAGGDTPAQPPPPPPRSGDDSAAGAGSGGGTATAGAVAVGSARDTAVSAPTVPPSRPAHDVGAASTGRLPVHSSYQARSGAPDAAARAQAQAQAQAAALALSQHQNPASHVAAACIDHLLGQFVGHLVASCKDTRAAREALYKKLESAGHDVGRRIAETLTRDYNTIGDTLEVIKFVCREVWMHLFGKPINQLQTNHRGVYVLHDHSFRWLKYVAGDTAASTRDAALRHCVFPCGLLRGALGALGVRAVVRADIPSADKLPYCTFHIRIKADPAA